MQLKRCCSALALLLICLAMTIGLLIAEGSSDAAKAEAQAKNVGVRTIDPPVPAEVLEKSFIRADHDHKSKTLAVCSEGAGVDIVADWTAPNGTRWYQVKTEIVKGWIMARFVRSLVEEVSEAAVPAQSPASVKGPTAVSKKPASNGDYVTVTAKGSGTSRGEAVEVAWMEAVRLAVGVVITSKTEVTNEEISERIIAHSRGIVESYRVIDERKDGERVDVTIEARVHRKTLVDATKTYGEAFVVDASTSAAKDAAAKAKTEAQMKKTGMELLKEVLDSYGPEMFLTAHINPEIFYDKAKGCHTVEVIEVFNEKLFWDEFLPRLREALEGVAESKKKNTYTPEVRANNQRLTSEKFIIDRESAICRYDSHQDLPYCTDGTYNFFNHKEYPVIIPNDHSTYTSYFLRLDFNANRFAAYDRMENNPFLDKPVGDIAVSLFNWWKKMDSRVTHMVSFLDESGDVIHVQPYETGPRGITVYRSLVSGIDITNLLGQPFVFAPGFVSPFAMNHRQLRNSKCANFLYLDTTKMNRRWPVDKFIDNKVDRVKSIKLETIFEQ